MTRSRPHPRRDDWLCGYAAALAAIVRRPDGDLTLVRQTMISDGVTIENLRDAGVETYDLHPLRYAFGEVRSKHPPMRRAR